MNDPLQPALSPAHIAPALGRIPSGCFILTVARDAVATGVLLSWVQQASFDPPAVSFCIKRGRPVESLLQTGQRLLLNLIGEDAAPVFRHFGRGFALDEDAFAGLGITPTDFGPLLLDCPAHLGCELRDRLVVGDHHLHTAVVLSASTPGEARPYVHLRRNGLSY